MHAIALPVVALAAWFDMSGELWAAPSAYLCWRRRAARLRGATEQESSASVAVADPYGNYLQIIQFKRDE
jgi:extradiol dioxygenase family protein